MKDTPTNPRCIRILCPFCATQNSGLVLARERQFACLDYACKSYGEVFEFAEGAAPTAQDLVLLSTELWQWQVDEDLDLEDSLIDGGIISIQMQAWEILHCRLVDADMCEPLVDAFGALHFPKLSTEEREDAFWAVENALSRMEAQRRQSA